MIDWHSCHAAIWRQRQAYLRPVKHIDAIGLEDLLGIERQKQLLQANTERFLHRQPANNSLLWGARGTGKSSLVKAVFNAYRDRGLRLVEVDKQDLLNLPEIVDELREQDFRFVIYCDDLSFEAGDGHYKALKSVLDGSIELPPDNVLIYATSNRRHLLPERMADNLDSRVIDGEVHYADAIEEKISLSDRFGLWLSFYPQPQEAYLDIVDRHFAGFGGDREQLHKAALDFAHGKAAKNGRTAKQFFQFYQP